MNSRRHAIRLGSAALLAACLAALASAADAALVSGLAPDFTLHSVSGPNLRLQEQRGQVVMLNFWASWCGPCREEFPALDSLAGTYDTSRVVFFALSDDISRGGAERFLREHPVRHLRIGLGGGRLKDRYHYVGLPSTTLLDPEGRIAGRWVGFAGASQLTAIRDSIARQLAVAMPMHHHH